MEKFTYNKQSLLKNGEPWCPVMGEFHYSRYSKKSWKDELSIIKAGGVEIVSTYIFWIHHEEKEGEYDFYDNRDLRAFLHCAKEAGLWVFLRIGPWCHGEVRNGGLPDWILEKEYLVRSNEKGYLHDVEKWFSKIAEQVRGLFCDDGGPIIGIQIENEYGCCGGLEGEDGEKHMKLLKQLSKKVGLQAPLMTATGWGGAYTAGLLPVVGGYCDAPWDSSLEKLPPNNNYVFSPERNDENIGSDFGKRKRLTWNPEEYPFLTAELGGGLQSTRHRRAAVEARDIGALSLVKMGSGANLLGYYMYHGGTNPRGKYTTLQESIASGSWTDVAEYGYDFDAPIGEFGQIRDSYKEIKLLAMFLQDFGEEFCSMHPEFVNPIMENAADTDTLRTCIRRNKESGYIFVNNYQRLYDMKNHKNHILTVKNGSEELCYPARDINNGDYFFYPFYMKIGENAKIVTALATPLCILKRNSGNVYVFYSDVNPEYRIQGNLGDNEILTITRKEALNACKIELDGEDYLVIGNGIMHQQDNKLLWMKDVSQEEKSIYSYPAISGISKDFCENGKEKIFTKYKERSKKNEKIEVLYTKICDENSFKEYEIFVKYPTNINRKECFLHIDYEGDSAEFYVGGEKKTDHFYNGKTWIVGMKNYFYPVHARIRINAIKKSDNLYLEHPPKWKDGNACELINVFPVEREESVFIYKKKECTFLAPFEGQKMTDVSLHFKWTKESDATEYLIEMSDCKNFANIYKLDTTVPEESEVGYYFPSKEELPIHDGLWYARVKEKGKQKWSKQVSFEISMDHSKAPIKRVIDREHPWFTIFDYSEHEQQRVWKMLPEELKPYTGIGLIASYKAKAENIISYMMDEDAKGYPWHLGALGPHEIQFGKYTITNLSEIEYVMQKAQNLVSVGFVEQYLGTKDENYWRNEYFFRLLVLCAKYGITFIYSDGNRNNLELAAMIKRPFFMDKMREYADYFILSYKQNHAHASYSCYGALLGVWIDDACCQIGMQAENWYWNDAGFRDKPGECYGYLQGNEQQITACMTVEMLLTGLSLGAVNYSCEGESWLIECGKDGELIWSSQGLAVLAFFQAVIAYHLIPSKKSVIEKIHVAVQIEKAGYQELGDAWTGGILREIFNPLYYIKNNFELFMRESRYFYLPLITDKETSFQRFVKIYAGNTNENNEDRILQRLYEKEIEGNVYFVKYSDLMIVMNSEENEEIAQWFDISGDDTEWPRMQGSFSLWQYMLVKRINGNLIFHINSEKGKSMKIRLAYENCPAWYTTENNVSIRWINGWVEVYLKGSGVPVEFIISKKLEESLKLVKKKENPEENKTIKFLCEVPFDSQKTENGCCMQINKCGNISYGKLPLSVEHLRYRYGFSLGSNATICWKLEKKYQRFTFLYGFDIDAWMPQIIDKDNIIWDRYEKKITMCFEILGDNKVLFQSQKLTDTGGLYFGEVDVSGIEFLEFVLSVKVISEDPLAKVYVDILNPMLS